MASINISRVAATAGANPNAIPLTIESPSAKSHTGASIAIGVSGGNAALIPVVGMALRVARGACEVFDNLYVSKPVGWTGGMTSRLLLSDAAVPIWHGPRRVHRHF